jgi:hypothetical protein
MYSSRSYVAAALPEERVVVERLVGFCSQVVGHEQVGTFSVTHLTATNEPGPILLFSGMSSDAGASVLALVGAEVGAGVITGMFEVSKTARSASTGLLLWVIWVTVIDWPSAWVCWSLATATAAAAAPEAIACRRSVSLAPTRFA